MESDTAALNCNFFTLKMLIEKVQPALSRKPATKKDLAMICQQMVETMPASSEKTLLRSNIYEFLEAIDDITQANCNFSIFNNQRFTAAAQALQTAMKKYNIFTANDHLNDQISHMANNNRKMFQLMMFYGFSSLHIDKLAAISALQSLAINSAFYCLYDECSDAEFFSLEPLEKLFGEAEYLYSANEIFLQNVKITHTETQFAEASFILDEIEKIIQSKKMAHIGLVAPYHNCLSLNIIANILSSKGIAYYDPSSKFLPATQNQLILYAWATFQEKLTPPSLLTFMRQLLINHILEFDDFNKILDEFSKAFDNTLEKNCTKLLAFIGLDEASKSVSLFKKYPLLPCHATFFEFFKLTEKIFPKIIASENVEVAMAFKTPISRANFCTRLKGAILDKRHKISTHCQNNSKIWLLSNQQAEKYTFSHLFVLSANEETWLSQSENIFLSDEIKGKITSTDKKITTSKMAIDRKRHFLDNLCNLSPNIFITDHKKNTLTSSTPIHIFEDNQEIPPGDTAKSYLGRIHSQQPKPSPKQIDEFKRIHALRRNEAIKFGDYDYSLDQKQMGTFSISCKAIERAITHPVDVWNETILGIKSIQRFEADAVTIQRIRGTLIHNLLDFSFAKRKPQKIPTQNVFHSILEAKLFGIHNKIKTTIGHPSPLCENIFQESLQVAMNLADHISKIGEGKWFFSEYPISGPIVVSEALTITAKGRVDMIITSSPNFPDPENSCENIIIDYKTGIDNPLTPAKFGKIDDRSGEINLSGLQLILYALALRSRGCKNLSIAMVKEDFFEEHADSNIHSLNDFSNITHEHVIRIIKNIAIYGLFGQQKYGKFLGINHKQISILPIATDIINKRAALLKSSSDFDHLPKNQ